MKKVYFDTSSLIKLYHYEEGTELLDQLFENNKLSTVFLSELAKVEFNSAIWKKVRTQELTHDEAQAMSTFFETDYSKFQFVELNSEIVHSSKFLIAKYGAEGLRTLDSIQLASALKLKNEVELFVTADKLLKNIAAKERLSIY